jgi:pimeloyl-ACP methyl ester carboxylesterase
MIAKARAAPQSLAIDRGREMGMARIERGPAMGTFGRLVGGLAAAAALVASPAPAAPACLTPAKACEAWIALGDGKARAMAFASYPLDAPNPRVRRALIMVHGTLRNADHYFATATAAAFLAGALDDTLVIAPAFRSADKGCDDRLAPGEVGWSCHGDSWRSGGTATTDPALTSFDFMDALLRTLADKRLFPNLASIVVAGHSAGGQFVARYQMAGKVHETLGVAVSYVVANPSSYAWPDASRVLPEADAYPANAGVAWQSEAVHTNFRYGPFDADEVPAYDHWPYGLEDRKGGYTAGTPSEALRRRLASRPVTYLFGQVDVLPLGGFDDSASAMAQGPTRRARGEAFVNYINTRLGAHAKAMIVPECGHNDRCIYTTDSVLPLIFPKAGP